MPQWEYSKIDLNGAPCNRSDLDLLAAAGRKGWELVSITANHIAYLKRRKSDQTVAQPRAARAGAAGPAD